MSVLRERLQDAAVHAQDRTRLTPAIVAVEIVPAGVRINAKCRDEKSGLVRQIDRYVTFGDVENAPENPLSVYIDFCVGNLCGPAFDKRRSRP